MPIAKIDIAAVEPFADSRPFGGYGPYVRIHGVAKGELDPAAARNAVIVDLDKSERNARGMVEYEIDLFMLRPADIRRGSGTLVYDVTNRGRKVILGRLDEAPGDANTNDPRTARDAGLGFTLGRGYTLVWSGWDSSAPSANNGMTSRLPMALENGEPMIRRIRHEFHIGTRTPGKGDSVTLSYPAVSTDTQRARLTMRDRESEARTEIPSDSWEFVDARTIRLLPEGSLFAPYKIYEIWYEATGSRVIGVGFAAVRDLVSFLRHERADSDGATNPLIEAASQAEGSGLRMRSAFGVSQSGRFLRHFLELGMNQDSQGRRVFDGVLTHVAGAGKTFANHSFAMPGRTATQHEDRLYPRIGFRSATPLRRTRFPAARGALLQGQADRSPDDRGQYLDRVLAEGRLARSHRPGGPQGRRHCRRGAGST